MADNASDGKVYDLPSGGSDVKPKSAPDHGHPEPANDLEPVLQELYQASNTPRKQKSQKSSKKDDHMNTAKSVSLKKKSKRPPSSVRRYKPTVLTFHASSKHNETAYCMFVLCNISDVPLHFTLKGCKDSNVHATFGDGLISPHAQLRTLLTMDRPKAYKDWSEAPQSRILLATRFLDAKNDQEVTYTRLLGNVSRTKKCKVSNPPVEQLLLDAMGNLTRQNTSIVGNIDRNNTRNALADLINKLSDNLLLLILLAVIFVLFGGDQRR